MSRQYCREVEKLNLGVTEGRRSVSDRKASYGNFALSNAFKRKGDSEIKKKVKKMILLRIMK